MPSSRMATSTVAHAAVRQQSGERLGGGLRPRARALLGGGAARGGLALARRGGLLGGRPALGRTALGTVLEIGDEPLQISDPLGGGTRRQRALCAAQRFGELLGDALADAVLPQPVEQCVRLGLGHLNPLLPGGFLKRTFPFKRFPILGVRPRSAPGGSRSGRARRGRACRACAAGSRDVTRRSSPRGAGSRRSACSCAPPR